MWFAFTHRPAIHKHSTYVLSCPHIPTSTAVCSRIEHLKRKIQKPLPCEITLKPILYSDSFCENNFVALKPTTIPPSIHPFSSDHILLVLKSKINLHLTKHVLMAICFCQLSFLPLLATLAQASANEKNIQTVLSSKIALAA